MDVVAASWVSYKTGKAGRGSGKLWRASSCQALPVREQPQKSEKRRSGGAQTVKALIDLYMTLSSSGIFHF